MLDNSCFLHSLRFRWGGFFAVFGRANPAPTVGFCDFKVSKVFKDSKDTKVFRAGRPHPYGCRFTDRFQYDIILISQI